MGGTRLKRVVRVIFEKTTLLKIRNQPIRATSYYTRKPNILGAQRTKNKYWNQLLSSLL